MKSLVLRRPTKRESVRHTTSHPSRGLCETQTLPTFGGYSAKIKSQVLIHLKLVNCAALTKNDPKKLTLQHADASVTRWNRAKTKSLVLRHPKKRQTAQHAKIASPRGWSCETLTLLAQRATLRLSTIWCLNLQISIYCAAQNNGSKLVFKKGRHKPYDPQTAHNHPRLAADILRTQQILTQPLDVVGGP